MVFFVLEVADYRLLGGLLSGLLHGDLRRLEGNFKGKNVCSRCIYSLSSYGKNSKWMLDWVLNGFLLIFLATPNDMSVRD